MIYDFVLCVKLIPNVYLIGTYKMKTERTLIWFIINIFSRVFPFGNNGKLLYILILAHLIISDCKFIYWLYKAIFRLSPYFLIRKNVSWIFQMAYRKFITVEEAVQMMKMNILLRTRYGFYTP